MRKALLAASENRALRDRAMKLRFVRRSVSRFMPGEQLEDALGAAAELAASGITSTLTLLGESHTAEREADDVASHYLDVLGLIAQRGLDAEISVKPTQLGLDFDVDRTRDRIARLMRATTSTVWIDMES